MGRVSQGAVAREGAAAARAASREPAARLQRVGGEVPRERGGPCDPGIAHSHPRARRVAWLTRDSTSRQANRKSDGARAGGRLAVGTISLEKNGMDAPVARTGPARAMTKQDGRNGRRAGGGGGEARTSGWHKGNEAAAPPQRIGGAAALAPSIPDPRSGFGLILVQSERVGRVRLQLGKRVVDMRVARLVGPDGQDHVPHRRILRQAPVRQGDGGGL